MWPRPVSLLLLFLISMRNLSLTRQDIGHFERLAEDVNPEFRKTTLTTDEVSLYPNEVMRVRLRCIVPPGLQQRVSVVHVTKADDGDNYAELWQGLGNFAAPHEAPVFLLRNLESSTLLAFDYNQLANFDLEVLAARFPSQPPARLDVHAATTVPYPLQQVDVNNLRALRAATLAITIRSAALVSFLSLSRFSIVSSC